MRFQAVGAHRAVAALAERRRRLPRRQVADEQPVRHQRRSLRRHALVVVAERAEAAGNRRVRRQIHDRRSRSGSCPACPSSGSSCPRRPPPSPARGPAQSAWPQLSCTCSPSWLPSRMIVVTPDGQGFAVSSAAASSATRGAFPGQVVALHELPALRALVPPDAVRVRPLLHLALVDRRRLDAAARLHQLLLDEAALAAAERLLLALVVHVRLRA